MPLMTPAAISGFASICTAMMMMPGTPNSSRSTMHHQHDAEVAIAQIDVALHPVVRRAAAEFLRRLRIARLRLIQLGAFEQHLLQTEDDRAVRIVRRLAAGMMLAMHGHPFLGHDAGAHPEPEAEEVPQRRMQIEAAMGGIAVQIQRDAHEGELHHQERHQHVAPEAKIQNSVEKIEIHWLDLAEVGRG